jgi:3-isopropylmalate/(R)-2-methylmalate dehydratase large subunit
VFNSWITKDVRVKVPESVKVVIHGKTRPNVTAKDLILKLLSLDYIKSGKALAKVMEYSGETIEAMEGISSDPDAEYAHVIELKAEDIYPMVATPGDPGNGKYVRDLNTPVPVEIAYGGTCTAGKNEDMDMYARVLADALKEGKRVADSCKFYIQFGSQETREYSLRKGYVDIFKKAGAIIIEPSCGACINAGPGVSTRPDQIVISAQNRNFPGRSGPGQMYLASPLTVAASAVAGYITEYKPASVTELLAGTR